MSVPSNITRTFDPQIPINQGIYETSTTQLAPLGSRIRVGEKTFHYALAGTTVSAGTLLCSKAPVASHQSGIATVSADTAALGKNYVTVTLGTAAAANDYTEGYVSVASQALGGGGLHFKVKSHAAISSAGTGVLYLYDTIPVATVASGPVNLVYNMYNAVTVGSQALGYAVGVAPVSVTSGEYFWIQTYGPTAVKHAAANAANGQLVLGTLGGVAVTMDATTNGGVAAVAFPIGKNIGTASVATQCNPVFLTIAP